MKASTHKLHNISTLEFLNGLRVDGYYTGTLHSVEGMPGIYRRVSRLGQSLKKKRPESLLGVSDGIIVEVVRDKEIEDELALAGFKLPDDAPAPPAPPQLTARNSKPAEDLSTPLFDALGPDDPQQTEEVPPAPRVPPVEKEGFAWKA